MAHETNRQLKAVHPFPIFLVAMATVRTAILFHTRAALRGIRFCFLFEIFQEKKKEANLNEFLQLSDTRPEDDSVNTTVLFPQLRPANEPPFLSESFSCVHLSLVDLPG